MKIEGDRAASVAFPMAGSSIQTEFVNKHKAMEDRIHQVMESPRQGKQFWQNSVCLGLSMGRSTVLFI